MISQEQFIEGFLSRLVKDEIIHLPGFGIFSCKYKSAQIDAIVGQISPPTKEIAFSPSATKNEEGIRLIASDLNVPFEELIQFYFHLRTSWNSRLAKKEIIQLQGLGRIFKEFSGEVKFKEELLTDVFKNDELPILNFRPVIRSQRRKEDSKFKSEPVVGSTYGHKRKKKNVFSLLTSSELLPITIGVASFVLILGFYVLLPKQPNFSNQSLAEKVRAERINKKPTHQLEAELAKDTFLEDLKEEKQLEEEVIAVLEDDQQNVAKDTSETYQEERRISPKKLQQAIIITGAYRSFDGAKRKINSLIAKGYNPYQDIKLDLHRVGITFSYREAAELQENLLQIQETISPQAWILK